MTKKDKGGLLPAALPSAFATASSPEGMSAAEAVLTNVFDWDYHQSYGGERMGPQEFKTLDQSLQTNLDMICPHVDTAKIMDAYGDLLNNRWLGDFAHIRAATADVIDACLRAGHGDRTALAALERRLTRKRDYMEKHYSDNGHAPALPLHVIADAMESSESGAKYHGAHKQAHDLSTMRGLIDKMPDGTARRKHPGLFGLLKR
jgi:hypothetical protein